MFHSVWTPLTFCFPRHKPPGCYRYQHQVHKSTGLTQLSFTCQLIARKSPSLLNVLTQPAVGYDTKNLSWWLTAFHGDSSQSGTLKNCNNSVPSGERTLTELSPKSHTIRRPSQATVNENGNLISFSIVGALCKFTTDSKTIDRIRGSNQHITSVVECNWGRIC